MIEFQKSQSVRLLDVYFIGPYLVWIAIKGKVSRIDKVVLGGLGALTILYNLKNYVRNKNKGG